MGTIINTVAISCAIAVVLCAWKVVNLLWIRPNKQEKYLREEGFKGNKYKVLFGDMKELATASRQAKSMPIKLSGDGDGAGDDVLRRIMPLHHEAYQKYGKNFMIWFGWKPRVYIMEPEVIKDVLMNLNDYQKARGNPLIMLLVPGLVSYEGERWAKHRKIINPAFHVEKLKNMLPAFEISCSKMIENWEREVSSKRSCELDVWSHLQALTCDAIARTSFGSSYDEGAQIFKLIKEQVELLGPLQQRIYIPGMWYLPTKRFTRIRAIDREINRSLRSIIDKRLKAIQAGDEKSDDLLGIMLESNMNEMEQNGNKSHGMTLNEVVEECKLFYFAGQETTASLLVWTMVLLSRHQDWQSRAREEVLNAFKNKKQDADGLNHLKVVTMIFHEVLRLYPPVVALARETYKDVTRRKLSLPSGVQIGLPIMLLHYDEQMWGTDAQEFKPERFSEGVSKATKNQLAYFPFGWGPRICIGQNFTMLEAKIALVKILQNFSFELSPSYVHAPHTFITVQPQFGAHLILHKL